LREEYGLRVSEDRVLWKVFGPQRDEVIGDGRRRLNEQLHA